MLAIFPGTTVFYPASVMTVMPRMKAYMLRFEDDDAPKPRKIAGATRVFELASLLNRLLHREYHFIQSPAPN